MRVIGYQLKEMTSSPFDYPKLVPMLPKVQIPKGWNVNNPVCNAGDVRQKH